MCEFDECAEFVFDKLEDQCPKGNDGPTCALNGYWDNSDEIDLLFEGDAPSSEPLDMDLDHLTNILDRLVETKYKVEEIITGSVILNMTTLPPLTLPPVSSDTGSTNGTDNASGEEISDDAQPESTEDTSASESSDGRKRKKRSYIPISCPEIALIMEDINILVDGFIDNSTYLYTTVDRHCGYILDSPVTHADCSEEELETLKSENEKLFGTVLKLREHMTSEVFPGYREEEQRIQNIEEGYQAYLKVKEAENAKEFENRTKIEDQLREKAIENRDFEPTPLPEYCVCPQKSISRRKREANETDTSDNTNSTLNETVTGNNTDVNSTTTEAPVTWPITCICPEDEDTTTDSVGNDTITNGTATNTTDVTENDSVESDTTEGSGNPSVETEGNDTESNSNQEGSGSGQSSDRRRKRSVQDVILSDQIRMATLAGSRVKRGLKYRCNTTVVLGLMFYDLYHKSGLMANKCCCPDYPGELFLFMATIDSPWISSLNDSRSSTHKDWKKMVDQEVRFLMLSKKYSELMVDGLLGSIDFLGFKKTHKGKVGAEFEIRLTVPHWDNDRKIEKAFEELIYVYRNTSEKNVLGRGVIGKYTKRDYLVDNAPITHRARRIAFKEEKVADDLSGSGSGEEDEKVTNDDLPFLLLILVPTGGLLLLCIPFCIALRSKACLCRQCC